MIKITGASVVDLRYPTSKQLDGSDAMNPDPDYSAAYLRLHTSDADLTGQRVCFQYRSRQRPPGRGDRLAGRQACGA